jgi:hypothetical protein
MNQLNKNELKQAITAARHYLNFLKSPEAMDRYEDKDFIDKEYHATYDLITKIQEMRKEIN